MKTFEGKFNKNSKGVFAISLVSEPATEETFIAMSKDEVSVKLAKVNEEQRILMGLVLQPNQMIYRNDGENEYQMFFSADTIKEYSHNFFKSGFQLNSKLEHDKAIEGVSFVESWLVADPKIDKSATFGMEYPIGSWMVTMKVDNDEIWNDYIKTGELQGFSIDGMVELEEVKEEFNLKSEINMNENKSILTKLKELVLSVETVETVVEEVVEVKMGSAKSGDLDIQFEGETLEVGSAVSLLNEEEVVALADGEYTMDDSNDVIVVKDGVVESINPTEEEAPVEEAPTEEKELAEEEEAPVEEVKEDDVLVVSMEDVQAMIDALRSELEGKLSEVVGMNAELKEEVVVLSKQDSSPAIVSAPTQMSSHDRIMARIKSNK